MINYESGSNIKNSFNIQESSKEAYSESKSPRGVKKIVLSESNDKSPDKYQYLSNRKQAHSTIGKSERLADDYISNSIVNTTLTPSTIFEKPKKSITSATADKRSGNHSTLLPASDAKSTKQNKQIKNLMYDRLFSIYLTPKALEDIKSRADNFSKVVME